MTIPAGVTVRKLGEPKPLRTKPRNLLEAAALADDLVVARAYIAGPLSLEHRSQMAIENLSETARWARLSPSSRLMEIANWLKAECFECMDLVSVDPISTIGD